MLTRRTPLARGTSLAPMSAKRRADLAAAGIARPYSTLMSTGQPARTGSGAPRLALPRKVADTGPDRATVDLVLRRDRGRCVRCGVLIHGVRGFDWSVQHRRARGNGGTSRPDTNTLPNLILLCGSGTIGCHGWVESNRYAARAQGWAIKLHQDPAVMPVNHRLYGWVLLAPDGGHRPLGTSEVVL